MRNGLAFGLGLILGAGGGGLVMHTILKQHYAQKADEEIAACREAFLEESAKRRQEQEAKEKEEKKTAADEAMKKYSTAVPVTTTPAIVPMPQPEPKPVPEGWKAPYVIDPGLFDALDNPHKTLGLKYFPKEGVVAHADSDAALTMEELDAAVGREALTHFGAEDSEMDRVCVRNDNWKVDYEICIQPGTYAEILKEKPWLKSR